jgi:hypothetical protein
VTAGIDPIAVAAAKPWNQHRSHDIHIIPLIGTPVKYYFLQNLAACHSAPQVQNPIISYGFCTCGAE